MVGDLTVGGVHNPSPMKGLAIRGGGEKKKKIKKWKEEFNIAYCSIKEINKRLKGGKQNASSCG